MAGLVINGVKFRPGEVEWEDAYGWPQAPLPDFDVMRAGNEYVGTKITSIGMVAKIGSYIVIITQVHADANTYDYTLVPFTRAKITYTRRVK